jgi:hypothetical protein
MAQTTIPRPGVADARDARATDPWASPTPVIPFTEAEIAGFRADDRHMAMAVVLIMSTIFLIAVFLYTVIAYLASGGPS